MTDTGSWQVSDVRGPERIHELTNAVWDVTQNIKLSHDVVSAILTYVEPEVADAIRYGMTDEGLYGTHPGNFSINYPEGYKT